MALVSVKDDILPLIEKELPPLECVKLRFTAQKCSLWQSKAGGTPYYPKGMGWPEGSGETESGRTLRFLAQLNFGELPHTDGFPRKGILQFFICPDGDYGLPHMGSLEGGYKVVYHENIITDPALLYSENDIPETDEEYDEFPVRGEYLITGEKGISRATADDHRFERIVLRVIEEKTGVRADSLFHLYRKEFKGTLEKCFGAEELPEELWEINSSGEDDNFSQTGGYPRFEQQDPRASEDFLKDHNIILFQSDCVYDPENDVCIEWGDGGTANFFITPEDLKRLDFSKVLFNWDCG